MQSVSSALMPLESILYSIRSNQKLTLVVDIILRPHPASSFRPLRSSLHRLDLLVPRRATAMTQSQYFSSIGPNLCNFVSFALPPSGHSPFQSPLSLLLSPFLRPIFRSGCVSERFTLRNVLFKYNTVQNVKFKATDLCRMHRVWN